MDVLLLFLTMLALLAAGGFAFVAWRLYREDRRRSAARVAALSSVLDAPPALAGATDADVSTYRTPEPVSVASMFDMEPGASVRGRPLIKAAVVGVMAVILVVVAAMGNRTPRAAHAASAAAQEPAPLELMSMRHSRQGTTLTVTGLVRNPAGGAEARHVTAIVFAFDRSGSFTASGRAPLDFLVLAPGEESPFVVTIPNVTELAKYRVSFRTEQGMLRHVDRRAGQMQLAQGQS
jgi:hypothetical protein